MALGNYSGGGSTIKPKQYKDVKIIAGDQISIGDTVYTIKGGTSQFVQPLDGYVNIAVFSQDGTKLILGGDFVGKAKLYSVSGTAVTYVTDLYTDNNGSTFMYQVYGAAFSPDGTKLIVGGPFPGYAKLYTISDTVTYISDIYANNTNGTLGNSVRSITFSPDGTKFILGGEFTGKAKIYTISGTTVTYISDIYADNSSTALSGTVRTAAFSPDGAKFVLGGDFTNKCKFYTYNDNVITYITDLYADSGTTVLNNTVYSTVFTPDGTKLIIGGLFSNYAKIYDINTNSCTYNVSLNSVSSAIYTIAINPSGNLLVVCGTLTGYAKSFSLDNSTATLISLISLNNSDLVDVDNASICTFSPDGTKLVIGGGFPGKARIYTVLNNIITFISYIYADNSSTVLSNTVYTVAFSPDGTKLIVGGDFTGKAKLYSVSGATLTYISDIYSDNNGTLLNSYTNSIAFSPDGSKFVLSGQFTGKAKLYSVNGTTVTYVSDIYADNSSTLLNTYANSIKFSPDGTKLIIGGAFTGYAKLYTISGTTVTYVSDIYADNSSTALSNTVYTIAFSPDGNTLILGGNFTGYVKIYSVSGTTVTYIDKLYKDNNNTTFETSVYTVTFSPDGTKLVVGGAFSGYAKIFSVTSDTTFLYITNLYINSIYQPLTSVIRSATFSPDSNMLIICGSLGNGYVQIYLPSYEIIYYKTLYSDSGTTSLIGNLNIGKFSPDGTKLIIGGNFTGYVKIYSVSGTTVTYISDLYMDNSNTAFTSIIYDISFSPDGSKIIVGGAFPGYAKLYTISGTTITYVSDIYMDNSGTPLSNTVRAITFSPDGTKFVLGGDFTGRAKLYSVSGTTVTYISDIYADNSSTALSGSVYSMPFNSDGSKLIVGGSFSGYAKIYTVNGTTVTYVSDIYADNSSASLASTVLSIAFSPDNKLLILCGYFSGYAKLYSISDTTVTYVSNIYADSNNTAFVSAVYTVAFSPDGTKFVLGGAFTRFCKLYNIKGTTITFINDARVDNSGTAFTATVGTIAFNSDGTKVIIGGQFSGIGRIFNTWNINKFLAIHKVFIEGYSSYQIPQTAISVGYSKNNIASGSEGTVRILGDFIN